MQGGGWEGWALLELNVLTKKATQLSGRIFSTDYLIKKRNNMEALQALTFRLRDWSSTGMFSMGLLITGNNDDDDKKRWINL